MKKKVCFLGLLVLLFSWMGCQKDSDNGGTPVVNIPVDFTLNLWEDLADATRSDVTFLIETTSGYECTNYYIDTDQTVVNNSIILTIQDIVEPIDCESILPGELPVSAKTTLKLENVEQGIFSFAVKLKSAVTNRGTFTIDDTKYALYMESSDGIQILHEELFRVPENMIWGFISYEGNEVESSVSEFYETIASNTTPTELLTGYYGYFSIDDASNLSLSEQTLYSQRTFFYYHYEGEENWLNQLIETYNHVADQSKMELKIFTSAGKEF